MLRWIGLAIALVALGLAAACGRQFTGLDAPNAGSISAGHMLIRFRVAGPLDFTNVEYLIVFNITGNGSEPYPSPNLSGDQNYSFAFVVGGTQYTSQPLLFQYYLAPGTAGLQTFRITIPPQFITYVPNSGGNPSGGGEFTIEFARSLLNGVANPTERPTPVGATASPTTTPQETWAINFITANPNSTPSGTPIDSMGIGGPTDTTFTYTVNTTQAVDNVITKAVGATTVANSSAQVQGFEVINAP